MSDQQIEAEMDFPSPMPPITYNEKQVDTSQVWLEHNYFCLIEKIEHKQSNKKDYKEGQRVTDAAAIDAAKKWVNLPVLFPKPKIHYDKEQCKPLKVSFTNMVSTNNEE